MVIIKEESPARDDAVERNRLLEPERTPQRKDKVNNRVEPGPIDQPEKKTIPKKSDRTVKYPKWRIPTVMFGLLLVGILIGIGHHLCYSFLDGKPVARYSQGWILRVATGAAFVVKAAFAISVGVAISQFQWYTFRRRSFKIGALDKVFTLQSNLLSFVSKDLIVGAPLILVMAALTWALGLISILAPSTLVVTTKTFSSEQPCQVPAFGIGSQSSLTVWEQASGGDRTPYGGPSPLMTKIAAQSMVGGSPTSFSSPCGQNCTYSTSFLGPAMSCDNESFALAQAVLGSGVVHTNDGAEFSYYNAVSDTEHASMLWILQDQEPTSADPLVLLCSTWNTTYDVNVTFKSGIPTYSTVTGNLTDAELVDWGRNFETAAYVDITINATMRRALDMAAVRDALYDNLVGDISMRTDEQNAFVFNTSFVLSNLVDMTVNESTSSFSLTKDLKSGIPELMRNITLSVMGTNNATSSTVCTSYTDELVYKYSPVWLLVPYFVGFFLSVLCAALGMYAIFVDGVSVEDGFSQILVTTRNPILDETSEGVCLTSSEAKELKEQRVRFGELLYREGHAQEGSGGTGHAAFGLEGQTAPIQKGRVYR